MESATWTCCRLGGNRGLDQGCGCRSVDGGVEEVGVSMALCPSRVSPAASSFVIGDGGGKMGRTLNCLLYAIFHAMRTNV